MILNYYIDQSSLQFTDLNSINSNIKFNPKKHEHTQNKFSLAKAKIRANFHDFSPQNPKTNDSILNNSQISKCYGCENYR